MNNSEIDLHKEDEIPVDKLEDDSAKRILLVGLFAGLAASACCAGPLILLMLGISGAWIGNLSALEPFRPFFIVLALGFLVVAYRRIIKKETCDSDAVCATEKGKKSQLIIFWIVAFVVLVSIAFPWYGALLFE